jgi:hypothetical protein
VKVNDCDGPEETVQALVLAVETGAPAYVQQRLAWVNWAFLKEPPQLGLS